MATVELLKGLHGLVDYWAALGVANEALKSWAGDPEIDEIRYDIGCSWQYIRAQLDKPQNSDDLDPRHRCGMINRIKYPWLRDSLHYRTPALLREINASLKNCEVRPVVFGPKGKKAKKVKEGKDVGPCGLFAKRDLAPLDLILFDQVS